MNKIIAQFICLSILFLACITIKAQSVLIKGQIVDNQDKGIANANVQLMPAGKEVYSNGKGNFSLQTSKKFNSATAHLVIFAEGYKTNIVSLKNRNFHHFITVKLQDDVFHLHEAVTTATRTPRTLANVPVFTRIITSQEIKRMGAVSLINVLESELPGFDIQAHANELQLNMQGMGSTSVLFLVNGERVSTGEQSNIDYLRFPSQDIERIEVIKGGASSLYGSNAIGAVVNIITKKETKPFSAEWNGQYRSTKEYMNNLMVGGKVGKFSSRSSLTYQKIGGYVAAYMIQDNQKIDTTRNFIFSQRFDYNATDKLRFSFDGQIDHRKRLTDRVSFPPAKFKAYRATGKVDYDLSSSTNLTASYLYDFYRKDVFPLRSRPDYSTYDSKDIQQSFRVQGVHNFSRNNNVIVGGEYIYEKLGNKNQLRDGAKSAKNMAFFAQHSFDILPDLSAVYGFRMDMSSEYSSHFSPKFSLMYKLDRLTFRGSYSNSYKSPTIKQKYMDFFHTGGGYKFPILGNKDLKPETTNDFSLSAEYTNRFWDFSVMGFYHHYHNKIIDELAIRDRKLILQFVNAGNRSQVYGAEAYLRVKLPWHFYLKTGYTYSHVYNPVNLSDSLVANREFTRPHMGIVRLEYTNRYKDFNFYASAWGKFASRLLYDDWNRGVAHPTKITKSKVDGYAIVNLMGRVEYKNFLSFYVELANIGKYIPNQYFLSPLVQGRSVMVGMQIKY